MSFDLERSLAVLARTPATLDCWLRDLPDEWIRCDEGLETFSPFDVVGHLIHGESTDWMPRLRRILEHGESKAFEPFDRFAQYEESKGKRLEELLERFAQLRRTSLVQLRALRLGERELALCGRHPELGRVTVRQLLATWVVHDLGHVAQIARVMAKHVGDEVGPWKAYLPVLTRR